VPDTSNAQVKYVEAAMKRHAIARPGQRNELHEPPVVTAGIIWTRPINHEARNSQILSPDTALRIGFATAH
jgi:hypothetical protein